MKMLQINKQLYFVYLNFFLMYNDKKYLSNAAIH